MNIFDTITAKIIATIEEGRATGSINWNRSGSGEMPRNFKTGKAYTGINAIMLMIEGRHSPYWLTFNQAKELGGNVRKGEKGVQCVFWGSREAEEDNGTTKAATFCKAFTVFNVEQIDGLELPVEVENVEPLQAIEAVEALVARSGATILHGGADALYSPARDVIQMPDMERFASAENYHAVQLHELTHWTGHQTRCNRDLQNRFGSQAYAMEELVAELGAAFLCAELGINGKLEHHASYIDSWLSVLHNDKRAVITAASKAQQAALYLLEGKDAVRLAA